ncbi:thioesterase [Actinocrinis puniceicyclus]|uniref:Thioesterase n=1 Tax=Actinocrinis puniceicyclus TaxID=977794 RepID=A0A8J8BB56_9ACTN|nr:alpha/beta fold hydrolase [Actinocrinis puniceicyclus]MBS2963682.1 thioesterase [Actinocrinis puniceicyclus]
MDAAAGRTTGALTPFLTAAPDPKAPLRLFCLHHAGGGASMFAEWQQALGPSVSVLAVQLPGRERRVRDGRLTEMSEVVRVLCEQLGPHLESPHVFYGHSMGALISFNLVHARITAGARPPEALIVGACNPPDVPPVSAGTEDLSRDGLVQWLLDAGGMSPMLLKYPDWVDAAVALLRDDLQLCNSHVVGRREPLPRPILAYSGDGDPLIAADAMAGWARHGDSGFELRTVPGGHLFVRDPPQQFLAMLRRDLAAAGADHR